MIIIIIFYYNSNLNKYTKKLMEINSSVWRNEEEFRISAIVSMSWNKTKSTNRKRSKNYDISYYYTGNIIRKKETNTKLILALYSCRKLQKIKRKSKHKKRELIAL